MPHDKFGAELTVGDVVTVEFTVEEVNAHPDHCNAKLRTVEPFHPNTDGTSNWFNTRQAVRVAGPAAAGLGLIDLYEKLRAAKELLTTTVPDGLERSAEVAAKVAEVLRDAAAFLRSAGPALLSAEDAAAVASMEVLAAECRPAPEAAGDARGPILDAILKQLIAAAIERILKRLRPQAV